MGIPDGIAINRVFDHTLAPLRMKPVRAWSWDLRCLCASNVAIGITGSCLFVPGWRRPDPNPNPNGKAEDDLTLTLTLTLIGRLETT